MPTVMPMAATLTHGSIRQMKPASVKKNADRKNPTPGADTKGAQIKRTDALRHARKQQPHGKQDGQGHHREPLVEQQKQRHDNRQHTVQQQPAGAEHHAACRGKHHDLRNAGQQQEYTKQQPAESSATS